MEDHGVRRSPRLAKRARAVDQVGQPVAVELGVLEYWVCWGVGYWVCTAGKAWWLGGSQSVETQCHFKVDLIVGSFGEMLHPVSSSSFADHAVSCSAVCS